MLSIANAAVYECPCAAAAATHAAASGKGSFPWTTQFPSSIRQYLLTVFGVVVALVVVVVVAAGVEVAVVVGVPVVVVLSSKHSDAQSVHMESLVLPALNCLPAGTFALQIVRNTDPTSMQFIPSLTVLFCDGPLYVMVALALASLMSMLPMSTSHTPDKTGKTRKC